MLSHEARRNNICNAPGVLHVTSFCQGRHHLSFPSPLARCSSDDPFSFCCRRPSGVGVQQKKQSSEWCAASHCSSSPSCAAAGVSQASPPLHAPSAPRCSSKAVSPKVALRTRTWQANMADVEHKAWDRMGSGAWTGLCLVGHWQGCDSLCALKMPSLMPVSGVYVCTLPYGVFLGCCCSLTALWHPQKQVPVCCQCRWPYCMEWEQELPSSLSFLFVSSWKQTMQFEVKSLGCVQRWTTKLLKVLKSYEEQLKEVGLFNQAKRRALPYLKSLQPGRDQPFLPVNKLQDKKKWPQVVTGEVYTGCQDRFLHPKAGQTLEQAVQGSG